MSGSASRFRRLPPPRQEPVRERGLADMGDLFDHYGVGLERDGSASPIVAAEACAACGWLCRLDATSVGCPVCGSGRVDSTPSS